MRELLECFLGIPLSGRNHCGGKNIPHLVEKIKDFPLNAKSFRNTAKYQNSGERFHQPPPPLVPQWEYGFLSQV